MSFKNLNNIGFIMDGNSTWAKSEGRDALSGYLKGMQNLGNIICEVNNLGIPVATCYAFSSENWLRPKNWIDSFMLLATKFIESDPVIKKVLDAKIKLKVIGNIKKLPENLQKIIHKYEEETANNTGTILQLAMSYGSRDEVVRAVNKLLSNKLLGNQLLSNKLVASDIEITEDDISNNLDTAGIPDPDLIIRTSGKQRLSNFLLWQVAYSELYFTDVLWPDFSKDDLLKAIDYFNNQKRTFGKKMNY